MRHVIPVLWLLPFLGVAALGADDLPQPKKDPSAPAPMPDLPAPRSDSADLRRLIEQVREQREALRTERGSAPRPAEATPSTTDEEMARLRSRLSDLVDRLSSRPAPGPSEPGPAAAPPPRRGDEPRGPAAAGVIDPVAMGQNYFRAGDYARALGAYRMVPLEGKGAGEGLVVKYMIATCLRKLGKTDEAVAAYREVAGARGDDFTAECARWQLSHLSWQREMATRLAQLRERLKALDTPP
jgi:hypothetical protein